MTACKKILNINDYDLTNRRFNGYDLRPFLLEYGFESRMCVWEKQSSQDFVSVLGPKRLQRIPHLPFSWLLLLRNCYRQADIIHYHLIHNGYFSLRSLLLLMRSKPSVWTIHDFWPLTGGCVYPEECGMWKDNCLDCQSERSSRKEWSLKKEVYQRLSFEVIVGSAWMEAIVKRSPLMEGKTVHLVPFGINTAQFYPTSQIDAKVSLGMDPEKFVISFRSSKNPLKNLDLIKQSLKSLPAETKEKVQIISFSERGLIEDLKAEFSVLDCGWVSDANLRSVYNASDLVIMPSRAETFGVVALEAMACGKTVVVGEGTALPDLAPDAVVPLRILDLTEMVDTLLWHEDQRRKIGLNNLARVQSHYTIAIQAKKTAEIYRSLTKG